MTIPSSGGFPAAQARTARSLIPVALLGLLACAASLALYALPIARPTLFLDDFQIVFRSWTWPTAWANVWVSANEHAMPLGRITTAALASAAGGRPTVFLTLIGWHGPLALILGMILVGLFVAREREHPFYGLVAMTLFGVSTVYENAIYWFSASFSVFALDTTLVALLAAQHAVRTGRRWPLAVCVLGCALAAGWFAIGILAGPLCSLYLLIAACEHDETGSPPRTGFRRPRVGDLLWAAAPLLGSLAFLVVSLPFTADRIMHLPHYNEKTAVEAFHPLIGLEWTCRSIVDNLAWSFLGVSQVMCSTPWVWLAFAALAALAAWWVWRAPRKAPVILGLGLIAMSYALVYSARAEWVYEDQVQNWDRYHLLPQLGLALFLAGGLPQSRQQQLSRVQVCTVLVLVGGLFLTQLPRGILRHVTFSRDSALVGDRFIYPLPYGCIVYVWRADMHEKQQHAMRRIEAVDALCREHHIAGSVARRVLEEIRIPPSDCVDEPRNESNWQFLHGSDDPREISDEEAKRLLQPALDN